MPSRLLYLEALRKLQRRRTGTGSGAAPLVPVATSYAVTAASYSPTAGATDVITAQLLDQTGAPLALSGRVVTWTKSVAGGSFSAGTSNTNASGIATITLTAPATVGTTLTVTATDAGSITGTSAIITTQAASPVATSYLVTSSNYSPVDSTNVTITAQLRDQYGANLALSGRTVTWTKSTVNGSFSSGTSVTDASGVATVTLTVPAATGTVFTVTATDGSSITGTSSNITTQAGSGFTPDAFISSILAGDYNGGEFDFYTGTKPRSTNMAAGATLLGTFTFATPAATSSDETSNTSTGLHLLGGFVYADGTVGWCRVRMPDGSVVFDGDVGIAGSGKPFIVDDVTWVTGQTMTVTAASATTGT